MKEPVTFRCPVFAGCSTDGCDVCSSALRGVGSMIAEQVWLHMQGEHAHRVWNLIYSQSCFTDITQPDVCTERKVFYRLISGGRSTS